jgi:hypothetical protein
MTRAGAVATIAAGLLGATKDTAGWELILAHYDHDTGNFKERWAHAVVLAALTVATSIEEDDYFEQPRPDPPLQEIV